MIANLELSLLDEEPNRSSRALDQSSPAPATILRFALAERLLHWAIAIPFLGCLLSAVVLIVVYNPDPTRAYRSLFAWVHRGCAVGLLVCPSLVLLASVRHARLFFYNFRQGWVWRFDDIKWLVLMGPATLFKRITLPDQGKFNAAEKLNFMMVTVFPFLFAATGLLIWFPDASQLGAFTPWIIHCALAALAMPLVLGHMFMATVNPDTRVGLTGMISGFVSREWAAHHYARWFREQFPHLVHECADENPELAPQPLARATVDAAVEIYGPRFIADETEDDTFPEYNDDEREIITAACAEDSADALSCEASSPAGDDAAHNY